MYHFLNIYEAHHGGFFVLECNHMSYIINFPPQEHILKYANNLGYSMVILKT